jgi:hypothetical protein
VKLKIRDARRVDRVLAAPRFVLRRAMLDSFA